jgi:hypothetical protein
MRTPILICLAALTGIFAAEPPSFQLTNGNIISKDDPNFSAKTAVSTVIIARLNPPRPSFSRAMPTIPTTSYEEVQLADNEKRLPFTVKMMFGPPEQSVTGYVRLSDNVIFIFRPEKKDYIRSTLDPRFAPKKEIRVDPEKPA